MKYFEVLKIRDRILNPLQPDITLIAIPDEHNPHVFPFTIILFPCAWLPAVDDNPKDL